MKPPIIVDETGILYVFLTLEDAEIYLEAIDVENGAYVAYDSEGTVLELLPTQPQVTIRTATPDRNCAAELRQALTRMLAYTGISEDWLKDASLEELVERSKEFYTK